MGSVLAGTPKASRQLWGAGGSLGEMGCPFLRAHFPTRMEVLLLAGRFTRSPVPSSLTASPRPPVRPHSVPLAVLFPRGQDGGFPVRLGSARYLPVVVSHLLPRPAEVGFGGAAAFLAGVFSFLAGS